MMKWWGWGDKDITFPMHNKPDLWPWIRNKLGITKERFTPPVPRESIELKPSNLHPDFCFSLQKFLRADQMLTDSEERLLHSYGKSYPDLFYVRRGEVRQAPDMVILPESHEDVEGILEAANTYDICVIPFGGGTNIVGGVDPCDEANRMVVTVDMRRMNNLIALDPESRTATIQAGALGPKLEKDLQEKDFSLGHYPDSFEYSTLGGWLATRSAGMQSDEYGKIEDMVVSMRMVTPSGTITTRTMPASSAGPDLNQLMVGSEGILGIITEATMRVHRVPQVKDYRGFLFPKFEDGVAAIQECIERNFPPSLIRLQDCGETELAFHMKAKKTGIEALLQKPIKSYLKAKGYHAPCILIVGFEGTQESLKTKRTEALRILRKHRGFPLGKGVGQTWSEDKFNVPYLRDFVMDYASMADVAETATVWSNVLNLYRTTIATMLQKFQEQGGAGYIGCHISHTYKTGACLYFTYAATQREGAEMEQYYEYKRLITDTFMKNGATLSHHHAVGLEHRPWLEEEISTTGLQALRAVKASLDPNGILNPGKLLPAEAPARHSKERSDRGVLGRRELLQ